MNLIWLMLLMPTSAHEQVTVFPKSFTTKEACLSLGQVLIIEREFRCILQERETRVVRSPFQYNFHSVELLA